MSTSHKILVGLLASVVALAGAAASADAAQGKKGKQPAIATGPMDNGTLDPSWFGEGLEFREDDGEEVDYLWVNPGFTLDGHTLYFKAWPEPEFLGENANERDENDHRLARMMASDMARTFHDVFKRGLGGKVTTSLESGDVTVEGRIVDCSTGSEAAKVLVGFGAGSGNTTIDVKLTNSASGELLMAMHHRVVSGTTWSTTEGKFVKWIEKLVKRVDDQGLQKLYEKGSPRRD